MSLEKTFGKVEKPTKEKKLEVVASVDAVVDELKAYFEKLTPSKFDDFEDDFKSFMDYLQTFRITPEIITKTNEKLPKQRPTKKYYLSDKGIFLSAMIQTSYNQVNNGFIFNKVNADCFGNYLKGKKDNKIRIKVETIWGDFKLYETKYCITEIKNYKGECFGWNMENCTIKSENKKTLEVIEDQTYGGVNNRFELKK